jgi:hypothetical protein
VFGKAAAGADVPLSSRLHGPLGDARPRAVSPAFLPVAAMRFAPSALVLLVAAAAALAAVALIA